MSVKLNYAQLVMIGAAAQRGDHCLTALDTMNQFVTQPGASEDHDRERKPKVNQAA